MALLDAPLGQRKNWISMMLKDSGFEDILTKVNSMLPAGQHWWICDDAAYSEGYGITGKFKTTTSHLELAVEEAEFNARMSGVRIAVEQVFRPGPQ
ncbi:hypothetical protein V1515DRAFT_292999 [Lipomyces mesembrius]